MIWGILMKGIFYFFLYILFSLLFIYITYVSCLYRLQSREVYYCDLQLKNDKETKLKKPTTLFAAVLANEFGWVRFLTKCQKIGIYYS